MDKTFVRGELYLFGEDVFMATYDLDKARIVRAWEGWTPTRSRTFYHWLTWESGLFEPVSSHDGKKLADYLLYELGNG